MAVSDYDTTPASNTSINGIAITGTSAVENFDDALRQIMADIASHVAAGTFGTLTTTGAFTSLGIDDNATAERVQISNSQLTLGASGVAYDLVQSDDTQLFTVSGGNNTAVGANIRLYGSTHATSANDFRIRSNAANVMRFNGPSDTWAIQTITTANAFTIADDGELATAGNKFTLGNASTIYEITKASSDSNLKISGDTTGDTGANIILDGATSSNASDMRFRVGTQNIYRFDFSADDHTWLDLAGTENMTLDNDGNLTIMGDLAAVDLTLTGAFTSLGIDDNASAERLQITDSFFRVGATSVAYEIRQFDDTQYFSIGGGTGPNTGANIQLYGSTHATKGSDITLRSDSDTVAEYDASADSWTIGTVASASALAITSAGVVNFSGNISSREGDADGEISTFAGGLRIGNLRSSDGSAVLNLFTDSTANTTPTAQIQRDSGADGDLDINQTGNGDIIFTTSGTGFCSFGMAVVLPSYTVATLPSAATAGAQIFVTDETGGAVNAFADGTNWRRCTDRAIVS